MSEDGAKARQRSVLSNFIAPLDEGNKCRKKAAMLANVASGLVPGGHIAYVHVRQRGLYV
jgi:hypothetical protein